MRTYSEEGGVVLDNVMGSGTTAAGCEAAGRRWVGIELDSAWCMATEERARGVREGLEAAQ